MVQEPDGELQMKSCYCKILRSAKPCCYLTRQDGSSCLDACGALLQHQGLDMHGLGWHACMLHSICAGWLWKCFTVKYCVLLQLVLAIAGTTFICFLTNMLDEITPIFAATPIDHGGKHF